MRREWIEMPDCRNPKPNTLSPSMRREWIEIAFFQLRQCFPASPSMRREWIEMVVVLFVVTCLNLSPSMRREWIEIFPPGCVVKLGAVSLHAEGVD